MFWYEQGIKQWILKEKSRLDEKDRINSWHSKKDKMYFFLTHGICLWLLVLPNSNNEIIHVLQKKFSMSEKSVCKSHFCVLYMFGSPRPAYRLTKIKSIYVQVVTLCTATNHWSKPKSRPSSRYFFCFKWFVHPVVMV